MEVVSEPPGLEVVSAPLERITPAQSRRRTLVAILANPPTTPGARTRGRVALAASLLGFERVQISNMFAYASHSTGAIAELGQTDQGWLEARPHLSSSLRDCDAVLLAYGAYAPAGPARLHYKQQVDWLRGEVMNQSVPAWWVGDGPRHPSRWQRWTYRAHPAVPFEDALRRSFAPAYAEPSC